MNNFIRVSKGIKDKKDYMKGKWSRQKTEERVGKCLYNKRCGIVRELESR